MNDRFLLRLGLGLLALGTLIGLVTRPVAMFRQTEFNSDQARDALVYERMRSGDLPTLGPGSSFGSYQLPPLYYYLVFPFSLLGRDPAWQALPNALLSFLTVPLLAWTVFLLLRGRPKGQRVLFAGIAALWWSVLGNEARLANVEWNPVPIPFFLLGSAVLFFFALQAAGRRRLWLWAGWGAAMAVLSNLHSTTLFAVPVLWLLCFAYAWRGHGEWRGPLVALGVIAALLLPYAAGEAHRGFTNTHAIVQTLLQSPEPHTAIERLERAAGAYTNLWPELYASGSAAPAFGGAMLVAAAVLALTLGRGTRRLLLPLVGAFVLMCLEASRYWSAMYLHYKALLWPAPVLAVVLAAAALDWRSWRHRLVGVGLASVFAVSLLANAEVMGNLLDAKYGATRLPNTNDVVAALRNLPKDATVCAEDPIVGEVLAGNAHRSDLQFRKDCRSGDVLLRARCRLQENYLEPLACEDGGGVVTVGRLTAE